MPRPVPSRPPPGLAYQPGFLSPADRAELLAWLKGLRPLWELRYPTGRPLPEGQVQRPLLRPVYWLGSWQFACLGYYEPPRRTRDVAVQAEPFPPVLRRLVDEIEARVRRTVPPADVPKGWRLDTCLVNFYGHRREGDRWVDVARVGEHRDHEPGPVASLSLGERAAFQFVTRGARPEVVRTTWLEDGSLQLFGAWWKDRVLHRVQRVEDRRGLVLPPAIDGFRTRRINLTFRHVPPEHVQPFARLSPRARDDVRDYVRELAVGSPFFRDALDAEPPDVDTGRGTRDMYR